MHALVTGGTGFVGAYVVRRLLDAGAQVRVLRRASSPLDLLGDAAADVEHVVGDVTDPDAVREAMRGATHVVHAAAVIAFGPRTRGRMHAVNVAGTAHVADAARAEGVARLVHVSSIAALGRAATGGEIDEDTPWTPGSANTRYAVSKRDAEREVWRAAAEGLDAVAVLPALVFGRGRRGEGTQSIVDRVAAGRMRLAPPGATAVVDVRDVAEGVWKALTRAPASARYVLAAENLSWLALLTTLARALGETPPAGTVPGPVLTAAGALSDLWRAAGGRAVLSLETARTAAGRYAYSGRRAEIDLGLTYRSFAETATWIAGD